ncbi:hypothetical protein F4803DRAFT_501702 [Xylaria telfairii]|nr:hypothetical protein F4803DRAFT_501702 [Xylaria telfairii]
MPVTTRPSPSTVGKNLDREITFNTDDVTVFDTVTSDCHSPYEGNPRRSRAVPIMSNSFSDTGFSGFPIIASSVDPKTSVNPVSIYNNGFVHGLIRAFNQDLHLVIRPDDVWQAILSQFSLFINGNVERLRHMFVTFNGKRTLTVDVTPMRLSDLDLGKVAQEFASRIQDNIVDEELRQWMMPDFSTTTSHDKAVAAFSMMGAMQQYFDYVEMCGCGLPSVTLLGIRRDWEVLAGRVGKLYKYGEECRHWAGLLQPVMRYMLRTFDEPDSQEVKDFWLRVAYEAGSEGSNGGICTLSGWITAFVYFEDNGQVTRDYKEEEIQRIDERAISWWVEMWPEAAESEQLRINRKRLTLDGVSYPLIRSAQIPRSIILLPMTIMDAETGVKRFATAISGTIGMSISGDGTKAQPASAWWVVQEFEEPMESLPTTEAGQSVTGSTTEESSNAYASSVDILDDNQELKGDEDFDDETVP